MFGKGLLTGMLLTLKKSVGKKDTIQYPDEKIPMTARYRGGVIDLNVQKCIACGLCALSCPNEAIKLTTEKTEDNKKRLSTYHYLSGYCMFCNLCIEACPTKAIVWDKNYEIASYHKEFLNYDCLARAAVAQAKPVEAAIVQDKVETREGGVSLGG
jgi:NADH-quinone oxidoreductase subunit I